MKNLIPHFIHNKYKAGETYGNFQALTMFMDISGFTPMTERLMCEGKEGAEVLSAILNNIFKPVIQEIYNRGGFISTFAGDAFTCIFPQIDDPMLVVYTALIVNGVFRKIGTQKTKFGDFPLSVKLGLSTGNVNWGIIGSEKHKTYFLRGEAVNGCAYSEHHCGKMDIVIDDALYSKISSNIDVSIIDDAWYLLDKVKTTEDRVNNAPIPKLNREVLENFIRDKVMVSTQKGEFRDIVSVFVSFKEPDTFDILNEFTEKVISETDRLGGYFNKIDFGDKGGVILILFGAPVSYENDRTRALELIYNLKEIYGDRIRAGITYGIAYTGFVGSDMRSEYTALGDVVNQSARFMMKADWGHVWVSNDIYRKLKNLYNFGDHGKMPFKGKSEPIQVFELLDKKENIEYSFFAGEMVGRDVELSKIKEWSKTLEYGKFAGVVYLYGEAGMGKSRIAYEFVNNLGDNVTLSQMQCDSILKKSFNPVAYFLNNYFKQNTAHTIEEQKSHFENVFDELILRINDINDDRKEKIVTELRRTKSIISAQIGVFYENSLYSQLEAKLRYENTLIAVRELFKALSLIKPVIILLEDIHWIDGDTHKIFDTMTRVFYDFPIMIIATSRFNDDGTKPVLNISSNVPIQEIIINKLTDESVKSFVEILLKSKVSDALIDFIKTKAENNPFYIEQICLYLSEHNLIEPSSDGYIIKDIHFEIPSDIHSVIISRIDRLSNELKETIQVASVLGR